MAIRLGFPAPGKRAPLEHTLQRFKLASILKYSHQSRLWKCRPVGRKAAMTTGDSPSIAEHIRRDLGAFTPNERRAAHRLLADYPVAGLDTAARFGNAAGVSAPTVLRMIAKLGFASYGSFQDALRGEIAATHATPLMKGARSATNDPLGRFADAAAANLEATAANLPREEFAATVRLLADPRRTVYVLGGRFTDHLAGYFAAHLRVLRPGVRRLSGQQSQLQDQLLDVARRDIVIVFDIRRYSEDLNRLAAAAARRGAIVVLFTDQWLSPISRVARHVLPAHVTVPSIWDSGIGLVMLVEAILSATSGELGPVTRKRLNAIEDLRKD
jgi:DNA-binding MurR/RpiR family transcriptional regulator